MKFSRDRLILLLLALALLAAMVLTLTLGGNRSRHGYGSLTPDRTVARPLARQDGEAQGAPRLTGNLRDCQDQMPPRRLYTSG